ncbi:hypothetical protein WDU94_004661, partial [Cyamophila willieti]
ILGIVPAWLDGVLVRNGPGSWNVGDEKFDHLFDCSALLHKFSILNGVVTYQCRFIKSDSYVRNHAARRIVVTGFGTRFVPDPCASIFQRIATLFKPGSDNTMVSVYPIQDQVYALGDSNYMHRIDMDTLDTQQKIDLARDVTILNQTSHPITTSDGKIFNLGIHLTSTGPRYCILQLNEVADNVPQLVTSVPVRWRFHPGYMHTFAMTSNYYIIVEQPLSISVPRLVRNTFTNQPLATCLKFFDSQSTLFHVLDRTTGAENIHSNPAYAQMFRARPLRFRLDLNSNHVKVPRKVEPSLICEVGCETPRLNEKYQCRKYKYFYAISSDIDRDNPGTLIKVNVDNNTYKSWSEKGVYPSEPVFVSSPHAKKEDEGLLLSILIWCQNPTQVSLLILNSRTMQEMGKVHFSTPSPVPKCLHGWFFPRDNKRKHVWE